MSILFPVTGPRGSAGALRGSPPALQRREGLARGQGDAGQGVGLWGAAPQHAALGVRVGWFKVGESLYFWGFQKGWVPSC